MWIGHGSRGKVDASEVKSLHRSGMPGACSRGQPLLDRLALLDHVSLDQGPRLVLLVLYLLHVGFDLLYLLFILLLVCLLLEPGGKVSLWSTLR